MDGRITWAAVPDATHYTIKLKINGDTYETITVYTPSYDLSDLIAFKNVQSLEIDIQAHGNSKCVASAVTRKEWAVIAH